MRRRAETGGVRRWDRDAAARNDLDTSRRFAVWGDGRSIPEPLVAGGEEIPEWNAVAEGIATRSDPEWAALPAEDRWVTVVDGDEGDADLLVRDGIARGYAAYLAGGKEEEQPRRPLRGTLRSDVGPRRKADQPRPYE